MLKFVTLIVLAGQVSLSGQNPSTEDTIYRLMFEAQDRYRNDNYRKLPRVFDADWGKCDEKYRWPACCLWSQKKIFARGTSTCKHIKGDIILENDHDAMVFQSFLDIKQIQGSLVLRNTTLLAFGMPQLERIGFRDSNPLRIKAPLTIENNRFLTHLRFRQLTQLARHSSQTFGRIEKNPKLKIDSKQYQVFVEATGYKGTKDFAKFKPPRVRFVRAITTEIYPYVLFGALVIGVFIHHFIMLEVNESRVKRKEKEMIECMEKMRDSTLAAELLLQTPSDISLSFDQDVLHLCTGQVELVRQIQKILDADVRAFNDASLEEVTPLEK